MRTLAIVPGLLLVLLIVFPVWAGQPQETLAQTQDAHHTLSLRVPVAPRPVKGEGKYHLVYELYIKNEGQAAVDLKCVEAFDNRAGLPLAHYAGQELLSKLFAAPDTTPNLHLGAGQQAVVFIWLTLGTEAELPFSLRHRVSFRGRNYFRTQTAESQPVLVMRTAPPVLQRPLNGAGWYTIGPENDSAHRRALLSIEGKLKLAQRFAIDWVQLDQNGEVASGDPSNNASYHAYGAEVLAVKDGVVTAIQDGIPENIPGPTRAVPITLETLPGNYVLMRLASGQYALYAHLQPGSLRVSPGDRVKHGQVLGLVGNSGNSTMPHLHFHLCNANSPLASEGLPFVFESFDVTQDGLNWEPRQLELPLEGAIIRFLNERLSWASHTWRKLLNG